MSAPNLDDPLDEAIAEHWRNDEDGAIAKAKEWTIQYANNLVCLCAHGKFNIEHRSLVTSAKYRSYVKRGFDHNIV